MRKSAKLAARGRDPAAATRSSKRKSTDPDRAPDEPRAQIFWAQQSEKGETVRDVNAWRSHAKISSAKGPVYIPSRFTRFQEENLATPAGGNPLPASSASPVDSKFSNPSTIFDRVALTPTHGIKRITARAAPPGYPGPARVDPAPVQHALLTACPDSDTALPKRPSSPGLGISCHPRLPSSTPC